MPTVIIMLLAPSFGLELGWPQINQDLKEKINNNNNNNNNIYIHTCKYEGFHGKTLYMPDLEKMSYPH